MGQSDNSALHSLALQQKNLLLAEPIMRLSMEKNNIFRDDGFNADILDTRYLALGALDFVMERSAIEPGALHDDIVDHVAWMSQKMYSTLTDEQAQKIGQTVLDYISNKRESHKSFITNYYDPARDAYVQHDFSLLVIIVTPDGIPRFKLGNGGKILTLAMLDIAPDFAQMAEAIMIEEAVKRGRFKDARELAQRAKMRSIFERQRIEDILFKIRRSPTNISWRKNLLPLLEESRTHLEEQEQREKTLIDSIHEHFVDAEGDNKMHLAGLRDTLNDCYRRHTHLLSTVQAASEEFRKYQGMAFSFSATQNIPSLEEKVLIPLLSVPNKKLTEKDEETGKHKDKDISLPFIAAHPAKLYDLILVFEMLTKPRFVKDEVVPEHAKEFAELEEIKPEFTDVELDEAHVWLSRAVKKHPHIDMRYVVDEAKKQNLTDPMLRCILFLMVRSWCPNDDPFGVEATIDGAINTKPIAGDNLVLHNETTYPHSP